MTKRLFSYPMDAHEEAEGVRQLLDQHQIEYYETPGNRWGFSNAAIWIKNPQDFSRAQSLFEEYQKEFAAKARKQFEQETGYNPDSPLLQRMTFTISRLLNNKGALLLLIIAVFFLAIYLRTFLSFFYK